MAGCSAIDQNKKIADDCAVYFLAHSRQPVADHPVGQALHLIAGEPVADFLSRAVYNVPARFAVCAVSFRF